MTGYIIALACAIAAVLSLILWALVAMQTVYLATSGMGWWNNRESRRG